ncbi:MAG: RNase adapter RapZ [Magnetococcales bacterium]|nr:RNase adapter RapZ [Magnetococcales bacterium]
MVKPPQKIRRLVLVAGMSGAGKSSALKYLEDQGFYWMDNPPMQLIIPFVEHFFDEEDHFRQVAIGIHIRNRDCLATFTSFHQRLAAMAERFEMIFLEAGFERLVTRYRETRRRHPLAQGRTVREAILLEASWLAGVRAMADLIIDTSHITVHQLKERLDQLFQEGEGDDLRVFIRSFGFKYGTNTDADMVLDGRFLANPYYDPQLRPLTGLDEPVKNFLEQEGEAQLFLDHLQSLFTYLIPRYRQEKKRYLTVDIGCTGGRHRSVYLVERLVERLREQAGYQVLIQHLDVARETPRGSRGS